ncbi:MAG: TlpA family protein disulfide reductase [Blastocatellia bacterium]
MRNHIQNPADQSAPSRAVQVRPDTQGKIVKKTATALPGVVAVFFLWLAFFTPVFSAISQGAKPTEALKRISKDVDNLSRDLGNQKITQAQFDTRVEDLIRQTGQLASQYKMTDWQGDELHALASLYQRGELFDQAAVALRAWLAANQRDEKQDEKKNDKRLSAMASLVRVLLDAEKPEEAAAAQDALDRAAPFFRRGYLLLTVSRIALHKDLAQTFFNRGDYVKAEKYARAGFNLIPQLGETRLMDPLYRDARDYDYATLAAQVFVSLHRLGRPSLATGFRQRAEQMDFANNDRLLAIFRSELNAVNLINSPSPGLRLAQWVGTPYKTDDFREKVLLLNFQAMWSAACPEAYPRLNELQTKYGSKGFLVLGMTRFYGRSDKEEDLSREKELTSLADYAKRYNLGFPLAVSREDDLTNDQNFGVISLPTMVLIDRSGHVRLLRRGTGNWRQLDKQVAKLIAEAPPKTPVTDKK